LQGDFTGKLGAYTQKQRRIRPLGKTPQFGSRELFLTEQGILFIGAGMMMMMDDGWRARSEVAMPRRDQLQVTVFVRSATANLISNPVS
jgi:hypothetical protein